MKLVPSREAAKQLGVHPNTLRRWAESGEIKAVKTKAGQRLYDVESFVGNSLEIGVKITYARVSSRKQQDDLQRQKEFLQRKYPSHELVTDIGSGLNFKRKGLISILERASRGEVKEVVVAHRDRLARFGFELINWIITQHGGRVVVLDSTSSSPAEELTKDLLAIITVFSCRIHGLRAYKCKIKEDKDLSVNRTDKVDS
jgi:putative resolvase